MMSITRAIAEGMILSRCQAILSEALGVATIPALPAVVPSPNAFLGWAVSAALLDCWLPVADLSNPTDLECSAVSGPLLTPKFWDCAEYHAYSGANNHYLQAVTSLSLGQASVSNSDLGGRILSLLKFKADQIKERYGVGAFNPGSGTIAVGQTPPWTPRPQVPPGQNWPSYGFGRGIGYGGGYGTGYGGW